MRFSDVPGLNNIMTQKWDSLARFIHVLKPLAEVYHLPLSTMHIFYDLSGDLIAFNRNASIFFNLRYFEAWRKLRVFLHTQILTTCTCSQMMRMSARGPGIPLISLGMQITFSFFAQNLSSYFSRYFTLAHEIAHNLVQPHNSEHEFYFSAICEKHIIDFGKLLAAA